MAGKLDDYLNKLPKEQQEVLRQHGKMLSEKSLETPNNLEGKSGTDVGPTPTANKPDKARPQAPQHKPDVKHNAQDLADTYDQRKSATPNMQKAQEQAKQSLEDRYPSSQSKGQEPGKQQANEQDNER